MSALGRAAEGITPKSPFYSSSHQPRPQSSSYDVLEDSRGENEVKLIHYAFAVAVAKTIISVVRQRAADQEVGSRVLVDPGREKGRIAIHARAHTRPLIGRDCDASAAGVCSGCRGKHEQKSSAKQCEADVKDKDGTPATHRRRGLCTPMQSAGLGVCSA